jgi:hypothetical protein
MRKQKEPGESWRKQEIEGGSKRKLEKAREIGIKRKQEKVGVSRSKRKREKVGISRKR